MARPTDYTDDMPQKLMDHFSIPLYKEVFEEVASGGRVVKIKKTKPNSMPTFERFAVNIGVTHNTLRNWCTQHPQFFSAYAACKDIQKDFIVEHGLNNNYNAGFAKFVAINVSNFKDKVTHEVDDDTKKALRLAYNVNN
jgi:hypothetical protein